MQTVEMEPQEGPEVDGKICPPGFGYGFEMSIGLAAGRSEPKDDGLVQNEAKTAQIIVPDYDIFRGTLYLRGFLEWKRLVVELTASIQELFEDELVGEVRADDSVVLREIGGTRELLTLGVSWSLDTEEHFSIGAKYQRGEGPPKWEFLDTLKTTFTVRF